VLEEGGEDSVGDKRKRGRGGRGSSSSSEEEEGHRQKVQLGEGVDTRPNKTQACCYRVSCALGGSCH